MYRASKIHKKPCFKIARGEKTQCRKRPPDAIFRPAGKKKKTSGLVRQSAWGQRGQAGRTTRRWISPSSLKSWMVATARM